MKAPLNTRRLKAEEQVWYFFLHFPLLKRHFFNFLTKQNVQEDCLLTSVYPINFLVTKYFLNTNLPFLPFWASINDLTRTPSFHIAVSSFMPSSCPQPMAVVAVIPNRLSLVSLWLREAQRWWSWKLTRQLFLWLRLLFVERIGKWRSPRAR